jgi:hypothetical protein
MEPEPSGKPRSRVKMIVLLPYQSNKDQKSRFWLQTGRTDLSVKGYADGVQPHPADLEQIFHVLAQA